jgi:large repetitive protein
LNVDPASFEFTSTQDGSSFRCKLDSGAWSACTSGQSYGGLAEGSHVFRVRATNAFGEADPTPAQYSWTVDLTPPDTTITSSSTTSTSATFEFASSEVGPRFRCRLDASAYTTCTSPKTYDGLAAGKHVFRVYAVDRAGNRDGSPATFGWTIPSSPLG